MYTIDDIDIFIMTHNRSFFVSETIECLLKQTIFIPRITVLDNESSDNTEEIVKQYAKRGVCYVKTFGKYGNFYKAQELAQKTWVIHFHDDNLIHPEFFEKVLYVLNNFNGLSAVTYSYTLFSSTDVPTDPNIRPERFKHPYPLSNAFLLLQSKKEFAINNIRAETYPWPKISPCTPAVVYKTEILKNRVPMNDIYGKVDDIFLYMQFCEKGKVVLIADAEAVFVRQHINRDLFKDENSLSLEQAINWVKLYTDVLRGDKRESIWTGLLEMIFLMYSVIVKKSVQQDYPFPLFISVLFEKQVLPEFVQPIYERFLYSQSKDLSLDTLNKTLKLQKYTFWQKVFSIKNETIKVPFMKLKYLHLLGVKILLGVKK